MAARWSARSGAQWTIRCRSHQATLVEVGGGLREYRVDGEHVVAGYSEAEICPKGAGQVLAPWPNRIGGGRYEFGGQQHQLPINEVDLGTALHGLSRWSSWHRVDQTPESITLACILPPQPGYPYPLELITTWTVGEAGLRADHVAVNLGDRAAPFGLGTHPFIAAGAEAVMELPADDMLLTDEALLPTKLVPVAGTEFDFRAARAIGDTYIDTAFSGLTRDERGIARTRVTTGGVGAELWQDGSFGWIQVYNGEGPSGRAGEAVAVEPMTCPPDAFRSGEDVIVLEPGGRWTGSWGITPLR